MSGPAEDRSWELDEVRRLLFPDLSDEEGWSRIERACDGAAEPGRWARIEQIAGEDLSGELIDRIRSAGDGALLRCAGCKRLVSPETLHVFRADDPRDNQSPELVVYCRACAEREFGLS